MMSIMLNKLNEFGKKVQVDMVVRKVWQKLKREGYIIARCTVA